MATPLTAPLKDPGATYVVDKVADATVRALLLRAGLAVRPASLSDSLLPCFLVSHVLTERELQVLTGMAAGKSNADIGHALFLSEDTVKSHARTLFRKMRARDRAHAVAIGYERGILGGA
ncbi:response regulator transcription factor [Amycolatopsis kentuckyensis]|uniref:response regulator transcription factor n=1 Tax=Amycolatopsis kentuckyensis TaxID=218823 RepID=UPI003EBCA597